MNKGPGSFPFWSRVLLFSSFILHEHMSIKKYVFSVNIFKLRLANNAFK